MDLIKTGRFIAQQRKEKNLTPAQLVQVLGITDRAVSKRAIGKALYDSSIMLSLCDALGIIANDLSAERLLENKLLELAQQKELADKRLLAAEAFIGITATIVLFAPIFTSAFVAMET